MKIDPKEQERFNVILMSHNHAHVGGRFINSVNHHGKMWCEQHSLRCYTVLIDYTLSDLCLNAYKHT